jgi:hypothetical protein
MAETLKTLIGIQDQILKCRRLAAEIFDPETAKRLRKLADELEQRARGRPAAVIIFNFESTPVQTNPAPVRKLRP